MQKATKMGKDRNRNRLHEKSDKKQAKQFRNSRKNRHNFDY